MKCYQAVIGGEESKGVCGIECTTDVISTHHKIRVNFHTTEGSHLSVVLTEQDLKDLVQALNMYISHTDEW